MNKKILLSLIIIGLLITGCGKEEISEEPITNEMITTPVDTLDTVLSGDNIRLLGKLENAMTVNIDTILDDDINYQEIEYKIPENTQIINVYKIEVKDIDNLPMSFSKKVEVTITADTNLEQDCEFFKIGEGFTPIELDYEIENNVITFKEKEFGYFVLVKPVEKVIEEPIEEDLIDENITTEEQENTESNDIQDIPQPNEDITIEESDENTENDDSVENNQTEEELEEEIIWQNLGE